MKEEPMISNHWKIFYFLNSTVTANPKRPLWLESFSCKADAFVKLNTIMSIKNVPLLAPKWERRLYLHCKSQRGSPCQCYLFFWRSAALGVAYQRIYRKEPSNRFETKILRRIFIEAEVVYNVFPLISKMRQNLVYILYSCYHLCNSFNPWSTRVFPSPVFFHADDKYDSRVLLSVCCTISGVFRNHCRFAVRQ